MKEPAEEHVPLYIQTELSIAFIIISSLFTQNDIDITYSFTLTSAMVNGSIIGVRSPIHSPTTQQATKEESKRP